MKQIQAYIKCHTLTKVSMALQKVRGLTGVSVLDVRGFGRREPDHPGGPRVNQVRDFARYVKIEIFCHDELVDELVSIIDREARTGLRGDGKIYVLDVERGFKVGKGEIQAASSSVHRDEQSGGR